MRIRRPIAKGTIRRRSKNYAKEEQNEGQERDQDEEEEQKVEEQETAAQT